MAACRIYDVDVYRNVNGWTSGPPNVNYVSQTFVCTADSLVWAEFFVGAANAEGQYQFAIKDGNQNLYTGACDAAETLAYEFVRCSLSHVGPALIKGKEYVLKITHSTGEPINFYYSPENPYAYGGLSVPGGGFQPPPGRTLPDCDLACRIEGVNYPVSREEAVLAEARQKQPDVAVDSFWLEPEEPKVGQPVRFGARVRNQGSARAGKGVSVTFYASDDPVGSARSREAIAAGATRVFETGPVWTPEPGEYLLQAEVNPARVPAESDQDNNCRYLLRQIR
jgi:hypothetical protein